MTQELLDLRLSILEGRYQDALAIVDELEGMSKQAILRNIASFLVRIMIHLIKNQIEQRLTNSWVASISDSLLELRALNLRDNKTSHYIKPDEWLPYLEEATERAIRPASVEVLQGRLKPFQLSEQMDRSALVATAEKLIALTYQYPAKDLPAAIDACIAELPGGDEWFEDRQ
jgi:hypothetical protein